MTYKPALIIALAALLINLPRLVLVFLQADGIGVPLGIESAVLAVTGIAQGVVLTGGGMYLAHTLGTHTGSRQSGRRWLLAATWGLLLVFAVILIAPSLAYGLAQSTLAEILTTPASRWTWSVVAVLAAEILAGSSMLALALEEEPAEQTRRRKGRMAKLLDAGAARILARIEPAEQALSGSQASTQPAPVAVVPASNGAHPVTEPAVAAALPAFICTCGRSFGSQSALNAHKRFCSRS